MMVLGLWFRLPLHERTSPVPAIITGSKFQQCSRERAPRTQGTHRLFQVSNSIIICNAHTKVPGHH